jgi:cytochrome c biogenesis protein CcmG, thiol:disulfide interchange protein DsbE
MRAACAIVALAAFLLAGCGSGKPRSAAPSPAVARAELRGSPAPLARLHARANRLLGGGAEAFRRQIAALRSYPVVVNQWGSWCPPCRSEFPFFQRLSVRYGKRIAFLGVDGSDRDASARRFLGRYPVSYPSFKDPDLGVAKVFHGGLAFPTTVYYDPEGRLSFIHQGAYASEAKLAEDIRRYAR